MATNPSERRGRRYRFDFFRNIVNDTGHSYRCPLDTIEIFHARSPERALSAALRRFERRHRVSAWDQLAHDVETHSR